MTEFGAGVVVPLVKFSEHMGTSYCGRIEKAIKWIKAEPIEREKIMQEDDVEWQIVLMMDEKAQTSEHMLESMLQMWAYGAADHLMQVDKGHAPESLNNLIDLMMDLRMPDDYGRLRGEEEWLRVLSLWSEAAMDLDEMIGVRPDWGDW
jgi:hypothetical protein